MNDSSHPPISSGGMGLAPHRAGTVLTMGILSIVGAFMCGILGIIFGIIGLKMSKEDLARMDAGSMDPSGRSNTGAGRICSIIGLVISACNIVIGILWVIFTFVLVGAAAVSGAANP